MRSLPNHVGGGHGGREWSNYSPLDCGLTCSAVLRLCQLIATSPHTCVTCGGCCCCWPDLIRTCNPFNKGSRGGLVICCFVDFVLVSALPGSTGTTTNKRLRTWPRPNQVVVPFAGFAQVVVLKNKTLISTAYAPEWTLRKRSSAGHCVEPVANRTERAAEATRSEHRECIQRKKRKQFGAENDKTGG